MTGHPVDLPGSCRIAIIGGGAIGASIAYHLCSAGAGDVILLEKTQLTEGATWHAAGLVGQFRSHQGLTRLMQDSVKLYRELAEITGQETGWREVGSLRVASNQDRWMEFRKAHTAARSFGFDMQLMTPREIKDIYPLAVTSDLVGAAYIADDGYVDPNSLVQAFARGIRNNGGRIFEGVEVIDLVRDHDAVVWGPARGAVPHRSSASQAGVCGLARSPVPRGVRARGRARRLGQPRRCGRLG